MNRQQRRAAAHLERKLAPKAGFPAQQLPAPASIEQPVTITIPRPISEARLAANRANAQLSTGAISQAGREASSQNHTKHGLARHNGNFKLLASEDPVGFEALKHSLASEHQPTTETESILINEMAESHWLTNRALSLQGTCFDPQTGKVADPQTFSLYLRYQTTHQRTFHKALNQLLKLRSETRKAEIGFEAQKRKKLELESKIACAELEKQVQSEERLRQDPDFRDLLSRLGMAFMTKSPEVDALKRELEQKYGGAKEDSQTKAA